MLFNLILGFLILYFVMNLTEEFEKNPYKSTSYNVGKAIYDTFAIIKTKENFERMKIKIKLFLKGLKGE